MYESRHDWADESPSAAVVTAVASAANCEGRDLPPLHASIDPDALSALLTHEPTDRSGPSISFTFAGWRVHADADGSVAVIDK